MLKFTETPVLRLIARGSADDDDDDDKKSTAPTPAPTPTPPTPNPPAGPPRRSSQTSIPSPTSTQTSIPSSTSTQASASSAAISQSGNGGLGVGASAGIGAAVALAIILILLGGWFCVRRRQAGLRRQRTLSKSSQPDNDMHDLESAAKGPAEMESGSRSEKSLSELPSPVVPVEADNVRNFAAELPGSEVPPKGTTKGDGERLFLDSPIDDDGGRYDVESKIFDEKKPQC